MYNQAYDYEKYEQEGYKTPESFSRRNLSQDTNGQTSRSEGTNANVDDRSPRPDHYSVPALNLKQENMSNPYMDRGYSMPYQISQNKYREQVFGSRPPQQQQQRPEPLDGRNLPPRNYRPNSYPGRAEETYRADYYPSPRQPQYEPMTYRSGRPDMGFPRSDVYVPYPQEPMRRKRYEYEQPPDIGFDPYAEQEQPKKTDLTIEDGVGPHPGWLLMLRFHREGLAQVQRALTMCAKHIEADSGRILGIARSYNVRIREGGDSWVTFGRMRHFGGGNWDVQMSPTQDETNYCVLVLYYPSLTRAIQWFDRDSCFKQKDFPSPHTTDCVALPLNSSVDTKFSKTLVMTEYPKISHPEYFRDRFSVPTENMMRTRFRASPYVIKATSIPTDDPRQRVARHLRGCWIKRNSIITLSMFDSLQESHRYFTDQEYYKCKEAQDRVSAPTTVVMDLEDWRL